MRKKRMTDTYPPIHQVTFDWRKVIMVRYWYKNQDNSCQKGRLPKRPTIFGDEIGPDELIERGILHYNKIEVARLEGKLDIWTPVCQVVLQAHHSLVFTGGKAKSIWREWNKQIYGKDKRKRSDPIASY